MALYQGIRSTAAAVVIATSLGLSACGGGGGSDAPVSNVLKLSTAIQSEHVAKYAGAFGMLAGPGVAAIYTSVVSSFVQDVSSATGASSTACAGGGSVDVVAQSAGAAGLQAGESATVTFNQCIGQVQAATVANDAKATGTISLQVQSASGQVGSKTSDWAYTATETANNVTLVSGKGTNVLNGTINIAVSFDASTGLTTTTATAPSITINRTQSTSTSGNVSGTITVSSLAMTRIHGTNPTTDSVTSSAAVSVSASDAVIAFNVSTPTAVIVTGGDLQQGVVQLTTDDTVETLSAVNTNTVGITVTSGGKTANYTETYSDFQSIAGG
ncbi:hypothetical protein [Caballeronia sp. dw_276]|uniref:hypothetical protein n=1 Tax=Caballeronia sp. dw_276 TaxID=2719795 RepID=UPI001BD1D5CC|nr:hypothetical protein [Caballeronia sp. dw_276]